MNKLDGLVTRRHRALLKGSLADDILFDLEIVEEAIKQDQKVVHWIIRDGEYRCCRRIGQRK